MGGISTSAPPKVASQQTQNANQQVQGATPSTGNFYSNPQPQQNFNGPSMGGSNYANSGNPMGGNAPQYNPGLNETGMAGGLTNAFLGGSNYPLGNPNQGGNVPQFQPGQDQGRPQYQYLPQQGNVLGQLGLNGGKAQSAPQMKISDLYTNVLGRAPDAEGLKYWQDQFGGDTITSPDQVNQFKQGASDWIKSNGMDAYTQQYGQDSANKLNNFLNPQQGGLNQFFDDSGEPGNANPNMYAPQQIPSQGLGNLSNAVQQVASTNPNVNPNPMAAPRPAMPPLSSRNPDRTAMMLRHPQLFGKRKP